jgi:hypothetical protein
MTDIERKKDFQLDEAEKLPIPETRYLTPFYIR